MSAPQAGRQADHHRFSPFSWALFEWGKNPYIIIVVIYIYAPYFTTTLVGDPVRGQTIWGNIHSITGISLAILAPILGAIADQGGARKPWIALFTAIMVLATLGLWWGIPDKLGLPVLAIAALLWIATLAADLIAVFHNAMLPTVAPPGRLGQLSGLGLALGNLASVLILVGLLIGFGLPGYVDWPFVPDAPLFGLDRASAEPDRISAPIVALWALLFAVPLFLFTKDEPRKRAPLSKLVGNGLRQLFQTIRHLPRHRDAAIFLIARMIYNDGKTATLTFGGVYAAGIFGWSLLHMTIYGIVLSIFAVGGGFIGGWLDRAIGTKTTLIVSIIGTIAGIAGAVSMTPTEIFFVAYDPQPLHSLPFFQTASEMAYIGVVILVAVFITAAYAASRTMMARLSPPEKVAEFFGLYALSGTATAWMAPLAIAAMTAGFDSQRAGFAVIIVFLIVGLLGLLLVQVQQDD